MKSFLAFLALVSLVTCTHPPMTWDTARPDLTELDFYKAKDYCAATTNPGGSFAIGSPGFLAVVAIIDYYKAENARKAFIQCMEAHGYHCVKNCPDPE